MSSAFFLSCLPEKKFPKESSLRKSKSEMLGERVFKLIINIFCVAFLAVVMSREDCDFMDVRVGGRT
jgi:uncharacterized membrane protein YqhA